MIRIVIYVDEKEGVLGQCATHKSVPVTKAEYDFAIRLKDFARTLSVELFHTTGITDITKDFVQKP